MLKLRPEFADILAASRKARKNNGNKPKEEQPKADKQNRQDLAKVRSWWGFYFAFVDLFACVSGCHLLGGSLLGCSFAFSFIFLFQIKTN